MRTTFATLLLALAGCSGTPAGSSGSTTSVSSASGSTTGGSSAASTSSSSANASSSGSSTIGASGSANESGSSSSGASSSSGSAIASCTLCAPGDASCAALACCGGPSPYGCPGDATCYPTAAAASQACPNACQGCVLEAGPAPCSPLSSPGEEGDLLPVVCASQTSRVLCPSDDPYFCPTPDGGGLCFGNALQAFDTCASSCEACQGAAFGDGGGCYGGPPPLQPDAGGSPWPTIPWLGGPVLHHPELVVMTYQDFAADAGAGQPTARDSLEEYYQWLSQFDWINRVASEYGITGTTVLGVDHLGIAPAALTDAQVQQVIEDEIDSGRVPSPGAETIYFLHTPSTTTVTWNTLASCVGFGGYHGWDAQRVYVDDGGDGCAFPIVYSLIPTCIIPPGAPVTQLGAVDLSITHHLVESATDPLSTSFWDNNFETAFSQVDGELSDLCDPISEIYPSNFPSDAGEQVATRIWSNRAAAAGEPNPCLPEVAPANQEVAQTIPADVIPVTAGESTSFTTTGLGASAAPSAWTLHVFQITGAVEVMAANGIEMTSGKGVTNTIPLTIPSTAKPGDSMNLEMHVIENGFIVDQAIEQVVLVVP